MSLEQTFPPRSTLAQAGLRGYEAWQRAEQDARRPRPLTAAELIDAFGRDPAGGVERGKLHALADRAGAAGAADQRRALEALIAATSKVDPVAVPERPWRNVHPSPPERRGPLTPAKLAWFNRVSTDPAAVDDDTARRLMQSWVDAAPNSDDELLIEEILEPIEQHIETNIAEAELRRARARNARSGPLPEHVYQTVAKALAEELAGLTPLELLARARQQVDTARANVEAGRTRVITQAENWYRRVREGTAPKVHRPERRPVTSQNEANERNPFAGTRRLG